VRLEIVVDGDRRLAEEIILEVRELARRAGVQMRATRVVSKPRTPRPRKPTRRR